MPDAADPLGNVARCDVVRVDVELQPAHAAVLKRPPSEKLDALLGLARHPLGKLAVLAVISLFLFHACHRLLHSLHDLGWHTGTTARVLFYGAAIAATALAGGLLWFVGF